MKKKINYLLLSLLLCFTLVSNVYAEDVAFELNTSLDSNEVLKDSYVDIKLSLNILNEVYLNSCSIKIESNGGMSFKEMQALNSWTMSSNNSSGNIVDVVVKNHQSLLSGTSNIINMRYVANSSGGVKVNSIECNDINNNAILYAISGGTLDFEVLDNTNKTFLKSLKINNEELNPTFSSQITSYNLNNFNKSSLSLEYEVGDPAYQDQVVVTVNDKVVSDLSYIPYVLVEDNKAMLITVTVAETTAYNIFVYKQLDSVLNNTLSYVTINDEALELSPGKFDYVVTVPDSVTSVKIAAELTDPNNFKLGPASNAPAIFQMSGKATAIMNVVSINSQNEIPSNTYTITIVNESYSGDVGSNPKTSDLSMYVMGVILLLSLFGSTYYYKKNLNAYK